MTDDADRTANLEPAREPSRVPHVVVGVILVALFALLSVAAVRDSNVLPRGPYTYDEADYMYAAEKGLLANYLDEGAISIGSFIEAGLAAGFDTTKWRELSRFIRSTDDITFYRHFHGPMYFYWLATVQAFGFTSETAMRYASLCSIAFTSIALVMLLAALFPATFVWIAPPAAALLLTGPSIILTANHITPHALYMLPSLVSLGALSLYCGTRRVRYWYGSVVAAAFAFATLEYALFLVVTMAVTLFVFRERLVVPLTRDQRRRFAVRSLACFVLPFALTWPGGLIKLTLFKNYGYYVYYTLVRGASYGGSSLSALWTMRLQESPAEYSVLLVAIASLVVILKRSPHLLPLALYGLLIAATTVRNKSTFPQYVSSAFPVFYLIAAAGLDLALKRRGTLVKLGVTSALVVFVTLSSARFFLTLAATSRQQMPFPITSLDEIVPLLADKPLPIFVNKAYVPTLHYYLPQSDLYGYDANREPLDATLERVSAAWDSDSGRAILIVDAAQPDTRARVERSFVVESAGTLFLSPHVESATWYSLTDRRPRP